MIKKIISILLFFVFSAAAYAQVKDIKRKAFMGGMAREKDKQLVIDSVVPGTTFALAGLKKNDVLVKINEVPVNSFATYGQAVSEIRAESNVKIEWLRGTKNMNKTVKAIAKPVEVNPDADITYDWIAYKNGQLRVISKKPKGKTNCPAILFIPGYNCSSVENFPNNYNGRIMNEWIKAGYAVICPEKSGNGDSYNCKPCVEADMQTDIETFGKAYEYMQQLPYVDKQNLFIWGHSMGGVIAPVLAEKYQPKGVIAFATVYRPWSEFLLEMHRIQSPLDGKSYEETETFVRGMQKVYFELFVNKKSPEEISKIPELNKLAVSELEYKPGNNQMWGRHWKFWQQIDSLNLAVNWSHVNGKVLSIFGGADFIQCSELEQKLIVETVNSTHPGNAEYLRIDNIDHLMATNNTWKESSEHLSNKKYQDANFNYTIAKKTIEWMDKVRAGK